MQQATKKLWLERGLDTLLFVITIASLAVSFWEEAPSWIGLPILLTFVFFFFIRWKIDDDSHAYLKANWFDLALIVLLASPLLRLLVAFKVAGLAPIVRIGSFLRTNRKRILNMLIVSGESLPAAMALVFPVVFFFGSVTFLLERGENPDFSNISDGLWWAFVTLTTVGYGDIVPITPPGRIVAVLTMLFGITLYSLMIANITYFVEEIGANKRRNSQPLQALTKTLTGEMHAPKVRRPRKLRIRKKLLKSRYE